MPDILADHQVSEENANSKAADLKGSLRASYAVESASDHDAFEIVFPSGLSVEKDDDGFLIQDNQDPCSAARKHVFTHLWNSVEQDINMIQKETDNQATSQIIDFIQNVEKEGNISSDILSQLRTGIVFGGYNSADQNGFYKLLLETGAKSGIRFATLSTMDGSVPECMKKIIDQLLPPNVPSDLELNSSCDSDIDKLVCARRWENEELKSTENVYAKQLAIMIPCFEVFPSKILQRLVKTIVCRKNELEITLILGLSTNTEVLNQSLPPWITSLLNTKVFHLQQSKECVNRIVKKIFIDNHYGFKLGHKAYDALLQRFHSNDMSVSSFRRGVQYALMCHYFGNPLSIFTWPHLSIEYLNELHFESIRLLPSFHAYIQDARQNGGFEDIHGITCSNLLTDDEDLYEWVLERVDRLIGHNIRFSQAITYLHQMQQLFESDLLKKPIRTLYRTGLSGKLVSDNHLHSCISLFKVVPRIKQYNYLKGILEDMHSDERSQQFCFEEMKLIAELLDSFPHQGDDPDEEEEDEESIEEEQVLPLEEDSRKRGIVQELQRVRKRRRTKASKKAGTALYIESDPFLARLQKGLTSYFKSALVSYTTLPLHEIIYYSDSLFLLSKSFMTESRAVTQTGLKIPKTYTGCEECGDVLSHHLPDTTILFKLYLESGKMINLQDWFEAFKCILEHSDEECEESVLQ